jgi:predicted pyridoxine 5'-phosphate oxidase superfamily flavin-nucleotide-binding protein
MQAAIPKIGLCFVATATLEGKPNVSPKGSLCVLDDDHLGFADIASPDTMRNLAVNPVLEINAVDQIARKGYLFAGTAEILRDGPIYTKVAETIWEREGRDAPVHAVVKVKVTQARPVLSPAYTLHKDAKEEEVSAIFMKRYGYQKLNSI